MSRISIVVGQRSTQYSRQGDVEIAPARRNGIFLFARKYTDIVRHPKYGNMYASI